MKENCKSRRTFATVAILTMVLLATMTIGIAVASEDSDADTSSGYITVNGIKDANEKYSSFEELYLDLKTKMGNALKSGELKDDDHIYKEETADYDKFKAFFTDNSMGTASDYDAKITYTINGTIVYDETDCKYLLSIGRAASYFKNDLHLSYFEIKGTENSKLIVNTGFTMPYQWWEGDEHYTHLLIKDIELVAGSTSNMSIGQAYTKGIDITLDNVKFTGLRCGIYINEAYLFNAKNCTFDGLGMNDSAVHLQGTNKADASVKSKCATINIENCSFEGYAYAINIDQDTAKAKITGCNISNTNPYRANIQIAGCSNLEISNNTLNVIGDAIAFHEVINDSAELVDSIILYDNTILDATTDRSAHFAYSAGTSESILGKIIIKNNKISDSIDLTSGVNTSGGKILSGPTSSVISDQAAASEIIPSFIPMPPTEDDFPGYVPSQTVEKEKKDDSTTQVAIVAAAIAVVLVAIIALLYKSR